MSSRGRPARNSPGGSLPDDESTGALPRRHKIVERKSPALPPRLQEYFAKPGCPAESNQRPPSMKYLTALLLLILLVLPAGMMTQSKAAPVQPFCTIVDDSGSACCEPAAVHCCCSVSPVAPVPPPPPLPSSSSVKEAVAPLPTLLILEELPRWADLPAPSAFLHRGNPPASASSVSFCVLRCSLVI